MTIKALKLESLPKVFVVDTMQLNYDTDFIKTLSDWLRPFRERGEVGQQVTDPQAAASRLGRVHRTNPLLRCPEA